MYSMLGTAHTSAETGLEEVFVHTASMMATLGIHNAAQLSHLCGHHNKLGHLAARINDLLLQWWDVLGSALNSQISACDLRSDEEEKRVGGTFTNWQNCIQ